MNLYEVLKSIFTERNPNSLSQIYTLDFFPRHLISSRSVYFSLQCKQSDRLFFIAKIVYTRFFTTTPKVQLQTKQWTQKV